ncbi:MAG: PIN domain-containing protein [Acidobacteria bacterium]|nr:PIN domain-containing protein [Acidobacteriota bacterium]
MNLENGGLARPVCFVDSNIWLYTFLEGQDKTKSDLAKQAIQQNDTAISTQVINEVCVNLIRKAGFDETKVQALVADFYSRFTVVAINRQELLKASELRLRHKFSYWDSLIVACALAANATILYSEDMDTSLVVEGRLQIINPLVD